MMTARDTSSDESVSGGEESPFIDGGQFDEFAPESDKEDESHALEHESPEESPLIDSSDSEGEAAHSNLMDYGPMAAEDDPMVAEDDPDIHQIKKIIAGMLQSL
jgi:hypothetical protein